MEHLPTADGRHTARVYYRYHKFYRYDQAGFIGFPKRKKIDEKLLFNGDLVSQIPKAGLAAFVQAWLFFGLLSEFSLSPGKIVVESFTTKTDNGDTVLTTKHLMEYLSEWKRDMTRRSGQFHMSKLVMMLDTAKSVINSHDLVVKLDDNDCLLIGALGETLQWVLVQEQRRTQLSIRGWTLDDTNGWGWLLNSANRWTLARQGWCSREVAFLEGLLKDSVCGLYYATTIRRNHSKTIMESHDLCTRDQCHASTIDEQSYQPRHVPKDCGCKLLQPNKEDVLKIVSQMQIPLLVYQENADGEAFFKVISYQLGVKFIVISHVWADGLGNPQGNAMLACQMKRLATLAKKFSEFQGLEVYFWIDSICVPVQDRTGRKMAISKMYDIYSKAHSTIVFSADLMYHNAGAKEYLEPAMRIATSGWMSRLWTFQEAAVSRNLYFLFKDGLKDIEDLESLYPTAALESMVASPARSFYTNLLRPRALHRTVNADLIISVWHAIQWRTTAKPKDEVLALAQIFDRDPSDFADYPVKLRMAHLLKKLPEIPAGMIFLPGKRLEAEGFRWAPSTWMTGQSVGVPDPLTTSKPSLLPKLYSLVMAQSVLSDRGLLVRYPGYCLNLGGGNFLLDDPRYFIFTTCSTLSDWYLVDSIDSRTFSPEVLAAGKEATDRNGRLGIICCRSGPGAVREIALLVSIIGQSDATVHTRWLTRVRIGLITKSDDLSLLKSPSSLEKPGHFLGVSMGPDQLWTVD